MRFFLTILLGFLLLNQSSAQGIDFFDGSFEEAKQKAATEGRLIFVDAYTTWCGPCKRMARNVFPVPAVGEYFNAQFINMKIDMEKGEGRTFQRKYGITAFPTLLWIDSDGKLVHKKIGGTNPQGLIAQGQEAAKKGDPTLKMRQAFETGERDPDFVIQYLTILDKMERPTSKIANTYLAEQKDLSPDQIKDVTFFGCDRSDSRLFDALAAEKNAYVQRFGAEQVNQKIKNACLKTVDAAIEFQSPDLLMYANDKTRQFLTNPEEEIFVQKIKYYHYYPDAKVFKKMVKESSTRSLASKERLAYALLQNEADEKLLTKMNHILKDDATASNSLDACFICAQLEKRLGNTENALMMAGKALQHAESENSSAQDAISKFMLDLGKGE